MGVAKRSIGTPGDGYRTRLWNPTVKVVGRLVTNHDYGYL